MEEPFNDGGDARLGLLNQERNFPTITKKGTRKKFEIADFVGHGVPRPLPQVLFFIEQILRDIFALLKKHPLSGLYNMGERGCEARRLSNF
jgi:hypothetical protein